MTARPKTNSWPNVDLEAAPTGEAAPDPFDLNALRLDQSFLQGAGAKKLTLTVPVRKPSKQEFVRVHRDAKYRGPFAIIELREDRETFLLTPSVARSMPNEFSMVTLYTAITRQGVAFLWPVKMPASDGRTNEWNRSSAEAAEIAMERWVAVQSNSNLGAYEVREAEGIIPEPTWPDLDFKEIVRIGFKGRLVADLDHPLVKRLRGLT